MFRAGSACCYTCHVIMDAWFWWFLIPKKLCWKLSAGKEIFSCTYSLTVGTASSTHWTKFVWALEQAVTVVVHKSFDCKFAATYEVKYLKSNNQSHLNNITKTHRSTVGGWEMKFVRILHVCFLLVIQHATIYSVLFLNDNIDTPTCLLTSLLYSLIMWRLFGWSLGWGEGQCCHAGSNLCQPIDGPEVCYWGNVISVLIPCRVMFNFHRVFTTDCPNIDVTGNWECCNLQCILHLKEYYYSMWLSICCTRILRLQPGSCRNLGSCKIFHPNRTPKTPNQAFYSAFHLLCINLNKPK